MKNLIISTTAKTTNHSIIQYFLFVMISIFLLTSCQKEAIEELDNEIATTESTEITTENTEAFSLLPTDVFDSETIQLTRDQNANARNSRTLIYSRTFTLDYEEWLTLKYAKNNFPDPLKEKIVAEVTPIRGNPDLYIHGYNANSSSPWRLLRSSTSQGTSTSGSKEVLTFRETGFFNNEEAYVNIFGATGTQFRVELYLAAVNCIEHEPADQTVGLIDAPVCGCDGKEYPNPGTAYAHGLTSVRNIAYCRGEQPTNGGNTNTCDENWSVKAIFNGGQTHNAVSMVEYKGLFYMAIKANDSSNRIYIANSVNGKSWSNFSKLPSGKTSATPALAVFKGKLFMAIKANDSSNRIYITSTTNGKNWQNSRFVKLPSGKTSAAPSLAVYKGELHMAIKANDSSNHIYVNASPDGRAWGSFKKLSVKTKSSPSLVTFGNRLYLYFRANDSSNRLHVISTGNGRSWGSISRFNQIKPGVKPSVSVFNNKLYLAYQANNKLYFTTSTNGSSFSSIKRVPYSNAKNVVPVIAPFKSDLIMTTTLYKKSNLGNLILSGQLRCQ